jgi:hypothetical protein
MDVVGAPERERSANGADRARALEQRDRHDEPHEREPRHGQEREPREDGCGGQEDQRADAHRNRPAAKRRSLARGQQAGDGVRKREERRERNDDRDAPFDGKADREDVGRRQRQAQGDRGPEPPPVEPDRLGHELADGAGLGRKRRRQLRHARDRSGHVRPRHLAAGHRAGNDPGVTSPPEKPLERDDVSAILSALFDIKLELVKIRRALEDGNGEEEAEDLT